MRLAIPDLVSNSYFPAIAAVELGYMRDEGLDVELELLFPVTDAAVALRNGDVDLLAGSAHAPLYADPEWQDVQILAALAQNMYWFLVVRPDLDVTRDTLATLHDVRIGAAPGPDRGLHQLLADAGIDIEAANISIAPVPGAKGENVSFGVTAAHALGEGLIDGFWANGMGTEVAVRQGVGKVVVDARRDGGPAAGYTFPALLASRSTIENQPDDAAAAVRAIVRTQNELKAQPELATQVGNALFPSMEAGLIAELVARDADFYDPSVSPETITSLIAFAQATGLTQQTFDYEQVVAQMARPLWTP